MKKEKEKEGKGEQQQKNHLGAAQRMDDATLRPRPGRRRLALGMAGVRSLPLPRMNAFEGLRGEVSACQQSGSCSSCSCC